MCPLCRLVVLAFWLLVRAASLVAQPADPSGHWEGSVQIPNTPLVIEVDVTRNANGVLAATFAQPSAGVKGFPFSKVEIAGRTLTMVLKASEQPSTFTGTLSADGKSISGDAEQAGQKTTFTLTRVGDARVAELPKGTRIPAALEGRWHGALDLNGKPMRLILTLANQPDGNATGTVMSPDGSGIEIPIGITVDGTHVAIDVPTVGAKFSGTVGSAEPQMTGIWTQSAVSLPLTFKRSTP